MVCETAFQFSFLGLAERQTILRNAVPEFLRRAKRCSMDN